MDIFNSRKSAVSDYPGNIQIEAWGDKMMENRHKSCPERSDMSIIGVLEGGKKIWWLVLWVSE